MANNSKTKLQFWERGVNAITGWKPARVKMNKSCVEQQSLKIKIPNVFKPKGFR